MTVDFFSPMSSAILPILTTEQQAPTHQLVQDAYFYSKPPDGMLKAGTAVHLVHSYGNLCRIQSSDGSVLGFVETGALRPMGTAQAPELHAIPSVVHAEAGRHGRLSIFDAYDASIPTFGASKCNRPAPGVPVSRVSKEEEEVPDFDADVAFQASGASPPDPDRPATPTTLPPTPDGDEGTAWGGNPLEGPTLADLEDRHSSVLPSSFGSDLSEGSLNRPRVVQGADEGYDSEYEAYVDSPSHKGISLQDD
eukprot:GGOE01053774.1.p3 GENE.GGOE01053774.1~~GGOE01053774.1.p3  ORF type:complete len:251 (+),score=51.05 GGOE01053774.1:11-763(+)